MRYSFCKARSLRRAALMLGAGVVLGALSTPARADLLSLDAMARGVKMTQQQCAALDHAVWVQARGDAWCMRYFLSKVGGEGRTPVVFLEGDQLGDLPDGDGDFPITKGGAKFINTISLQRTADQFSRDAGAPAIYLSRPGVDGSSGHHNIRHSELELEVVNAALEAIKARHGFAGFHLAGQSGGASLIGALLGLRQDIACAAPGSGRLARMMDIDKSADPAGRPFDALDHVDAIARNSRARILVVTDPDDKQVPAKYQDTFVEKLRAAGGKVVQFKVRATDPRHHGVVDYVKLATGLCVKGADDEAIRTALTRLSDKNAPVANADKPKKDAPRVAGLPMPPMAPTAPGARRPTDAVAFDDDAPRQIDPSKPAAPRLRPTPANVDPDQPGPVPGLTPRDPAPTDAIAYDDPDTPQGPRAPQKPSPRLAGPNPGSLAPMQPTTPPTDARADDDPRINTPHVQAPQRPAPKSAMPRLPAQPPADLDQPPAPSVAAPPVAMDEPSEAEKAASSIGRVRSSAAPTNPAIDG